MLSLVDMPAAGLWTFGSFFLKSRWSVRLQRRQLPALAREQRGCLPAESQPWSHGREV